MATVFTFIQNQRERQILDVLIESYGFKVKQVAQNKSTFVQLMQYEPEYIIIEFPQQFTNHLSLVRQIKSNRKTRLMKILCYGDHTDTQNLNIIKNSGADNYKNRPITTEMIREFLEKSGELDLKTEETAAYKGELEDTAVIMDPQTPTIKRIAIMVKRIGDLLAFPFTVAKVLSVTESEKTGAKELAKAIELDPVVVSNVLKVANSVEYGKVGSTITNVKDAIIRLGFTETKNIAISLSVMKIFSDEVRSMGFNREQFWYHSLTVAIIAGKLARRAGFPHPEVAFVCGLLHDFGIILLDEFFPTYLLATLHKTTEASGSFLAVQKDMWGMTHNDVVKKLFTQWNMPVEIQTVIGELINFQTYEDENNPDHVKLLHIIGISDLIAKSLNFGRECDEFAPFIENDFYSDLRCPSFKDDFFESIATEINTFSKYLDLKTEKFTFTREIPDNASEYSIALLDLTEEIFNPFEMYTLANGAQVHKCTDIETIMEGKTPVDAVVVICGKETRPNDLENITNLPKQKVATLGLEQDNNDTQLLPVVIIGGAYDPKVKLAEHIVQLPQSVDLRIVSFSIETLLLGYPFDFHASRSSNSQSTQKQVAYIEKEKKLTFTTDILNRQLLVINLTGQVLVSDTNELKHIVGMVLNKTKYICINFAQAEKVDGEIVLILDSFRQMLQSRGGILTLCNLGQPSYNPLSTLAESKVMKFADKTHLINHVNSIISTLKKPQIPT